VAKVWGSVDADDHEWIDTGIDDGIADPWTIVEPRESASTSSGDGAPNLDTAEPGDAPSPWERLDVLGAFDGTRERTLATVYARTDGPAAFYKGLTHSLHGESESGKSWIAQHAVVSVLANDGAALIVDFESSLDQVVPRLRALGMTREQAGRLTYVNPDGPLDSTFRELLGMTFDIAIIDGVTAAIAAQGGVSNSQDDVTEWHRKLPQRLATRTGAAVVQIDHVSKAQDGRGRFAIGSQAKMATLTGSGFYVDLGGQLAPGHIGEIRMSVGKDRPGDVRAHAGERRPDRLQPWARVTFNATDPLALRLALEPWTSDANGEDEQGPAGDLFEANTVAPWVRVVIPDETPARLIGRGSKYAPDLLKIMWSGGTFAGVTKGEVQSLFIAEYKHALGDKARARFFDAWACLDRSLVLAANGARYVLDAVVAAEIGRANGEPG
jgi:AAA domain